MNVLLVASKDYIDLGYIRQILSSVNDNMKLFVPDSKENPAEKAAIQWAKDFNVSMELITNTESDSSLIRKMDMVLIFTSGDRRSELIGANAIANHKLLHMFPNPY
jgi:hypothetical protein